MASDPWQIDPLPSWLRCERNPLPGLSNGVKLTLNALRHRPFGATTSKLATLSGLSARHTRRCLADLLKKGWVVTFQDSVSLGGRLETMWRFSGNHECERAISFMMLRSVNRNPCDDRVPPEFWHWFWSDAPGDALRISLDGVYIGGTLIAIEDPCARSWALTMLPTAVLKQCRQLRDFKDSHLGDLIDCQLAHRRKQAKQRV